MGRRIASRLPTLKSTHEAERLRGADEVLGLLMLAFEGFELPVAMGERLNAAPAAGVTLFRSLNVETPAQVLSLTESLQRTNAAARPGDPPLLVAADQEGGQLIGLGDGTTPFAGAMALGAAGDTELAECVGRAIGIEMAAMGVNVAYAPSCDLATNPDNAAIGIRSFGDDPAAVAGLAGAYVRGLRSSGIAATAKHFPGLGDVALDSHHGLPSIDHDHDRLDSTELVPFRAAITAGVDLTMSAHIALPAVTGDPGLPATLSRTCMTGILRGELGFDGVTITDAFDMRALGETGGGPPQAVAALAAGVDLLLTTADEGARRGIEDGLAAGVASGALDPGDVRRSLGRVLQLRRRLANLERPALEAVGSTGHRALAAELARRSVTLVRDETGLLPLRLPPGARIAAVMPQPVDLTPADTSSTVPPLLAEALRCHHPSVESFVTGHPPTDAEIAAIRVRASGFDLFVIGTIAAWSDPGQVALVRALRATGVPVVVAALRTPYDLAVFPEVGTYLCSFGILRPSLDALADVLWGRSEPVGRLPAAIPGLSRTGDRLER